MYVPMFILQTGSGKGTVSSLGSLQPDDDSLQDVTTEERNHTGQDSNGSSSTSTDLGDDKLSEGPKKATLEELSASDEAKTAVKGLEETAAKGAAESSASGEAEAAAKAVTESTARGVLAPAPKGTMEPMSRGGPSGQRKGRMRSFPERVSSTSSLGFLSRSNHASAPVNGMAGRGHSVFGIRGGPQKKSLYLCTNGLLARRYSLVLKLVSGQTNWGSKVGSMDRYWYRTVALDV